MMCSDEETKMLQQKKEYLAPYSVMTAAFVLKRQPGVAVLDLDPARII